MARATRSVGEIASEEEPIPCIDGWDRHPQKPDFLNARTRLEGQVNRHTECTGIGHVAELISTPNGASCTEQVRLRVDVGDPAV